MMSLGWIVLEQFAEQFVHLDFGGGEGFFAGLGGGVDPASDTARSLLRRGQQTPLLKTMQDRIEGARAHLVAVPSQLLDHRKPVDRLMRRMVQNVQPDQAGVEKSIISHIEYR